MNGPDSTTIGKTAMYLITRMKDYFAELQSKTGNHQITREYIQQGIQANLLRSAYLGLANMPWQNPDTQQTSQHDQPHPQPSGDR
jgi:hypothetical protein